MENMRCHDCGQAKHEWPSMVYTKILEYSGEANIKGKMYPYTGHNVPAWQCVYCESIVFGHEGMNKLDLAVLESAKKFVDPDAYFSEEGLLVLPSKTKV